VEGRQFSEVVVGDVKMLQQACRRFILIIRFPSATTTYIHYS